MGAALRACRLGGRPTWVLNLCSGFGGLSLGKGHGLLLGRQCLPGVGDGGKEDTGLVRGCWLLLPQDRLQDGQGGLPGGQRKQGSLSRQGFPFLVPLLCLQQDWSRLVPCCWQGLEGDSWGLRMALPIALLRWGGAQIIRLHPGTRPSWALWSWRGPSRLLGHSFLPAGCSPVSSLCSLRGLSGFSDGGGGRGVQPPHPYTRRARGEGPFKGL